MAEWNSSLGTFVSSIPLVIFFNFKFFSLSLFLPLFFYYLYIPVVVEMNYT